MITPYLKATAFAPGHISAFFEPIFKPRNAERTGSRGAGICVSLGATSSVTIFPALKQTVTVRINNSSSPAPVTTTALSNLLEDLVVSVNVHTTLELPVSQGFGMSAAGALSACLAAGHLLNMPKECAVKAAHHAEVQHRTGLGDVISSSFGGIEIRREPGLPPWGLLEHIPGSFDLVLCVIGKKMMTTTILSDQKKIDDIATIGRYCTKKLLENPSIEHLLSLSQEFTRKTSLASDSVVRAIDAVKPYGKASMCMLGNSVFAIGNTTMLCRVLAGFGKIYCCSIDTAGARLITTV